MTSLLLVLVIAAADGGVDLSDAAMAAPSASDSMVVEVKSPNKVELTFEKVVDALPPPPSDAEVPGLAKDVGEAAVNKNWLAALVPLILLALWAMSKFRKPAGESPVPPAPKSEQK